MFQQAHVYCTVGLGHTDPFTEIAHRFRRIASATDPRDGRHPRIVPSIYRTIVHHGLQVALAHNGIGQVQTRKFDLLRRGFPPAESFQDPVVKRSVIFEFQRADRMSDPFDSILDRMSEVVHRINAPFVASIVMADVSDTVDDRISHIHIRRSHIDFRPEDLLSVCVLAFPHFFE